MAYKILVLEDEKEIADLIEHYLTSEGYEVFKFYQPKKALEAIEKNNFDMAILDVMLPQINGFTICEKIREKYHYPVIMLTAKIEDKDKIKGLAIGADDYITKPFNPLEMIARVKAQLRRYTRYNEEKEDNGNIIDFSGLIINRENHKVTLYEKELELTPIEFSILWYLCENRGRVVSSEELFKQVWQETYFDYTCNNTIMVHIRRIREKMQEPARNPKFIKTVWGVGYKIEK